jgi:S-DNA-T family DNA segregation ATPase FtsK/SpoIIIE
MDFSTIAAVIAGAGGLGVLVWALAKLGRALIKIAEALTAAAVVVFVIWMMTKAVGWALRQALTHWRTSLTLLALGAWWHCWGPASLLITTTVIAGVLTGWRLLDLASFDAWAGRHLRSWWLRWTIYSPKLPDWLHACGLSIKADTAPVVVTLGPLGRTIRRNHSQQRSQSTRVLGVRSGASWDEVRIRLVPGQNRKISMRPRGRWPRRGASLVARSASCPRMWYRSISNAATYSPSRWSAAI